MPDDLEARLRARAGAGEHDEEHRDPVRSWAPRQGDDAVVVGRLIDEREVETKFGERRVATLETSGGLVSVWLSASLLRRAWSDAAPAPGDRVGIVYGGSRQTKDGSRTYGLYSVEVERGSAAGGDDELPF